MGMGMTEKQGGSDVRANTTRAELDGRRRLGPALPHHRPQVVHVGADVRRLPGAGADGRAGLSCFFLPRLLPDGSVNAMRIQRLKDKLGNHANASSEVEFERRHRLAGGRRRPRRAADPGDGHDHAAGLRARHRRPDAPGAVAGAAPHGAAQGLRQAPGRAAADEERARRPGAGKRGRHRAGAAPGARGRPHRERPAMRHEEVDAPRCSRRSPSSGSASAAATSRRRRWSAWAATATWKSRARA